MKKIVLVGVIAASLFACRQKKTAVIAQASDVELEIPAAPTKTCYQYIKDKDTATMTLNMTGKKGSGDLAYHWFQRDKNFGTFEGEFHGDTLIANYNFTAEGKQSMQQVVFLKRGETLIEGVGEVKIDGGNTLYRDLSMLTFEDTTVFAKVNCK